MATNTTAIYTDMDSIFDTRIAMLYMIDRNAADYVLSSGEYFTRRKDVFGYVSNDIFTSFYRLRNSILLEFATVTDILSIIKDHYIDIVTDTTKLAMVKEVALYVNIYPYELSAEEQDNVKLMINMLIPNIVVKFIRLSNSEVTPEWIADNVGAMYKYDGMEWIEYHMAMGNILSKPLLDLPLIMPAVSNGIIASKELTPTTYEKLSNGLKTIITAYFIDISNFSIHRRQLEENNESTEQQ